MHVQPKPYLQEISLKRDKSQMLQNTLSQVHALGLAWDDASGRNNGQYAPFTWQSA